MFKCNIKREANMRRGKSDYIRRMFSANVIICSDISIAVVFVSGPSQNSCAALEENVEQNRIFDNLHKNIFS